MKAFQRGFTLIELMITVVIMAILASIALPAYQRYIARSHAQAAGADLVALSLVLENLYQRTLTYPVATSSTSAATYLNNNAPGNTVWAPSQGNFFTYTLVVPTALSYTLTATGVAGSINAGCTLTLDNTNTRTVSGGTSCGSITSW